MLSPAVTYDPDELLTTAQAAELIGVRRRRVNTLVSLRRLIPIGDAKSGRPTYFTRAVVLAYIERYRRRPC